MGETTKTSLTGEDLAVVYNMLNDYDVIKASAYTEDTLEEIREKIEEALKKMKIEVKI